MFYESETDRAILFGDVLRGYISVTPRIKGPLLEPQDHNYNINVELPPFSVVLSPSCSIREKKISLTPLIRVRKTFFNNPYFSEDLTRINRKMKPQDAFSPETWKKKTPEEKLEILKDDFVYSLLEIFVYEENDLFPSYKIRRQGLNVSIRYYMIDLRNAYRIDCDKIIAPEKSPLESKCLQLSTETRTELIDKITFYYGRELGEGTI